MLFWCRCVTGGRWVPTFRLQLETDEAGRDVLMGHVSVGNEQKHTLTDGAEVLAIFPGPHAYVSPRWYTQMNVPTWNYISVHAYGTIKVIEGDALRAALSRLVDTYEHAMPTPVHMEEIPERTLEADLRGIKGFQITVTEFQAAYKLSQNRDEQSYHQVVGQLAEGDETARAVAAAMKENASRVFDPDRK